MRTIGWPAVLVAASILGLACSESERPAPSPSPSAPAEPAPSPAPAAEPEPAAEPADTGSADAPDEAPSRAELVERGKTVYMSNCIACHNMDPSQDGALGPAVTGSSRELLEARVLRAEYPEGYTPKRETSAMLALPHLEREIGALTAYLNQQG